MGRYRAVAFLLAVGLCVGCTEDDGGTATPTPCDICGTWDFAKAPVSNTGPCPVMPAEQGTATVTKTGAAYGLSISGVTCAPATACVFTGTDVDTAYVFTNSGAADDQGGTFADTTVLQFPTDSTGGGTMVSTYSVGGSPMCTWVSTITLAR